MPESSPSPTKSKRFETLLWVVFLIWAGVGLLSILLQTDAAQIRAWISQPLLQTFVLTCFQWGDFLFHVLAAANLFLAVSSQLGLKKTSISFGCIALLSGLVETWGTLTGFPFGSYVYTSNMGPMLAGTLPLAIPLAWWNILSPLYLLTRHFLPKLPARATCLLVALAATSMDWVMEPFAWKIKGYWIWEAGYIPWENYLSWFLLSFLLCRLAPLHSPYQAALDRRLIAVPLLMLSFFISARLIHGV
ncbi:MAG: carotenoid biosynthesis protein [Blastochloris sp.]|nr:carotenoid biosynthesis protein [Blastochloris sp.]